MLPAAARLRRREDFAATVRHGRRFARGEVVLHLWRPAVGDPAPESGAMQSGPVHSGAVHSGAVQSGAVQSGPKVGLIVSRAVGNSVCRHRVSRQLRHVMRPRLDRLGPDEFLVVRARPGAAGRPSAELAADIDGALRRAEARR